MSTALLALVLLAAGLLASLLLADARRVPRHVAAHDASQVSIIVPARNEATTLPDLLASLQGLATAPREVLVVDDSSDDGTAEAAEAAGATVIRATAPPPGWTGKAWACDRGATAAGGSTLVFLDADTTLEPDALDGLLGLLVQQGSGLVSVQPYHQAGRAYEQLSAYFNVMSLLASGAFARRRPRHPMAFGPALISSRADYERAGGHSVVRAEILDDARLAAAYDRAGMPVRCALGGQAIRMRMYPGGPRQLVEGWTKNIASGAAAADRWAALAAALWVASHWAVTVGAVLAVVSLVHGSPVPMVTGHPALWAVAWVGVALQLRGMLHRVGSFRWWTWVVFPVPLLAFSLLFVRSALLTSVSREVTWRGRPVAIRRSSRRQVR